MGLFNNKKKEAIPVSGKGDYIAPPITSPSNTPQQLPGTTPTTRVSNTRTVGGKPSFETSGDPDASVFSGQKDAEVGTTHSNGNSVGKSTGDAAKSAATPQVENLVSGKNHAAKQSGVPMGSPDAQGYDDPSVLSGNTRETARSYPTLRSAGSEDSKDSAFTITRNGQYLTLNGFANGHLMRWKFAAEEGPAFIRIPAVLLALGVIGTTAFPLIVYDGYWTIPAMICAVHTWVLSLLIIILEARVIGIRDPTNFRARIRGVVTRYINVTRLVWGRGLLYIYCASMNLTIDDDYVVYTAFPMIGLGLLAVGTGAHASYNLDRMKSSLTDEAFLWSKFEANDHDNDNKIDVNGFAELLWSLGLEFDDVYTFKAFQQIDKKRENMITFEQFKQWWIVTQNDGRRLRS